MKHSDFSFPAQLVLYITAGAPTLPLNHIE